VYIEVGKEALEVERNKPAMSTGFFLLDSCYVAIYPVVFVVKMRHFPINSFIKFDVTLQIQVQSIVMIAILSIQDAAYNTRAYIFTCTSPSLNSSSSS
jgi:hypothetical protein